MKIVSFETQIVPTKLGQIQVHIYGLGDDDKMYIWEAKDAKWELVKIK